jgi:hypothetical protein
MALRDKLAKRVTPFLESGEEVEVVFPAQSGPSPWWAAVWGLLIMVATGAFGYVTVVTTDRANVVLRNVRMFRFRPASVLFRGPRESLGNPAGIWGKISVGGERYWVHRRFHSDVRLANDLLPDADSSSAPQS